MLRYVTALCLWAFVCFELSVNSSTTAKAQETLFDSFTSQGVTLSKGTHTALAAPLLTGKNADESKQLLEKLSERNGWDRFSRNSPSAPVHVELKYVPEGKGSGSEDRLGHNIYSAFIAYAPMTSLKDEQLMASLFGSTAEDKEQMGFNPEKLSPEILKKAGIEAVDANTSYSTLRIPLMNRVEIEGTARIDKIEKNGSIVIAWQLDSHFTFDKPEDAPPELAKYVNRYKKIDRDELGKVTETPPVSYLGCGGYLSVQSTGLAENQLLIESRFAMYEPKVWFAGSNFLRSKFPPALQESAQTLRRKLSSVK